jgi:hypothetical protein
MTGIKERKKKFTYAPRKKSENDKMTDAESYDLIAYDIDTKKEVLRWQGVTEESGAFYTAGNTIIDGTVFWLVVGVRANTARVKEIDVRWMSTEFPRDAWMQYVTTSGIGYAFTSSESKAMHFEDHAQANRLRDRLAPQFPSYLWEVVAAPKGYCLVVRVGK